MADTTTTNVIKALMAAAKDQDAASKDAELAAKSRDKAVASSRIAADALAKTYTMDDPVVTAIVQKGLVEIFVADAANMSRYIDPKVTKAAIEAEAGGLAQWVLKTVEKMDAEAPAAVEIDPVWRFSIPNAVPLGPPIIAVNDVSFDKSNGFQ